jgi:hypothetical protein
MKVLAILQIVCILFLSSYSGMSKTGGHTVKSDCCNKSGITTSCKKDHKKGKDPVKSCSMLLTCGICGFLAVAPVVVKPATHITIESPVAIYKIGNTSGYLSSDWKPPRV